MSGHLAFPNVLDASTPASLSSWFLRDILRERIGYEGLIITDDLLMNGAALSAGSVSRAAKQALLAGNDIIMLSKTPNLNDPVWTFLAAAMKQEPEFRARVRDAARRVLTVKLTYLRGEKAVPYVPDLHKVETSLPDPEGAAFFLDLAARSVTVVKGAAVPGGTTLVPVGGLGAEPVIPLNPERAGKVLLAGQYLDFFTAGRKAYPEASAYWYSQDRRDDLVRYAQSADTIIFCLSDAAGLSQLRALRPLGKRIIIFSVLSPVYLDEASWTDGAIAVYSYAPESFLAGFSVLLGRIPGRGRLPFQG
jgi:beta-N-acetylhexosaminidase